MLTRGEEHGEIPNNIYFRFRSARALLEDHHELEKQEIYFSSLGELNDPMEGLTDVYWHGDTILWENLIRHYIQCFMVLYTISQVAGADFNPQDYSNVFDQTRRFLPENLKDMHQSVCEIVCRKYSFKVSINLIARNRHRVRRDELVTYLKHIHPHVVYETIVAFQKRGLIAQIPTASPPTMLIGLLPWTLAIKLLDIFPSRKINIGLDALFSQMRNALSSEDFASSFASDANSNDYRKSMLCFDYANYYVDTMTKCQLLPWYVSCFVKNPNDAAMWGNYADGHKGACLIFESEFDSSGNPFMRLERQNLDDRTSSARVVAPFRPILYEDRLPQIDFFMSFAKINEIELRSDWYTHARTGKKSSRADDMFGNLDEWRDSYYRNLAHTQSIKFVDWKHEREHRLYLSSVFFGEYVSPQSRVLRYNINHLKGLIFGINTSRRDKIAIVKVIKDKCRDANRSGFDLKQAYFDHSTSLINSYPIRI